MIKLEDSKIFFTVDHAFGPGQILVTRMLTRDLFAGNFLFNCSEG